MCIDTDHRPVTITVSRHKKRHMNKRTVREVMNMKRLEDEDLKSKVMNPVNEDINSADYEAAGIDGITTEMVLACGSIGVEWLLRIFLVAWCQRSVPVDWQMSVIVPLWKKREQEGKKRGISLLSHVG